MSHTILAVDDSRTIREMLRSALMAGGFDVEVAEDGKDGLQKLNTIEPAAMITDINMPKLDGFGFIDGVRTQERFRYIPILVLTTETGDDLKARAREKGATGWIVKPFDSDRLISVLNQLIA